MLRFCHWFVGLDCWTITGHADETIRQRKAAINWFFLEWHFELISYYKIVATAGQEATTNAVTGGTCAGHKPWATKKATENLCDDAIKLAVEEMIRWSTPIAQFSRTAQVDCEIRGKQIKKGDCLGLMYASNILTKRNLIILLVSTYHASPIIIWLLVLARINVWVCC